MADVEAVEPTQAEATQEDIDLIANLKEQGTAPKEIVRQMLTQNINFPTKTLMEDLGLSGFEVGQVKGALKLEEKGHKSRETKETPKGGPKGTIEPPPGRPG